jgi:VanZ family protein
LALNKKVVLGIAFLWTITITYLSLASVSAPDFSDNLFENQDKIVHFTFYFLFTLFWFEGLRSKKQTKKKLLLILFAAILYGIIMEICQGIFTDYRSPDKWDVLANSIGAFTAAMLLHRFRLKKT